MKKQLFSLALGLTLTVGYGHFTAHAEGTTDSQVVDPNSAAYDTSRLIENSVYDLTDNSAVKALLQSDYATKRAEESDLALKTGDTKQAQELINESNDSAEQSAADLSDAKSKNEDVATIMGQLQENYQTRVTQLSSLSAILPKQAQAGIAKAMANQKDALDQAAAAMTGAPASGDNQKSASQMESDVQTEHSNNQEKNHSEDSHATVQEQHASHAEAASQQGKSDDSQTTASQDVQGSEQTQTEDGSSSAVMGEAPDKSEASQNNTQYSKGMMDSTEQSGDKSGDD